MLLAVSDCITTLPMIATRRGAIGPGHLPLREVTETKAPAVASNTLEHTDEEPAAGTLEQRLKPDVLVAFDVVISTGAVCCQEQARGVVASRP